MKKMMKAILTAAGAIAMLSVAVPAYGTACSTTAINVTGSAGATNIGTEFNGCTLTGTAGTVTFNGFTLTAGATGTLNATVVGNTLGFVFNPAGTFTNNAYSVSYTASSCPTCQVTGANDFVTGTGTNTYSFTGATASGNLNGTTAYTRTVTGEIPATNTGNYGGGGGTFNSLMTLDITIAPTAATPEPTSLILFGSGFLAVGLVSRKRKKA